MGPLKEDSQTIAEKLDAISVLLGVDKTVAYKNDAIPEALDQLAGAVTGENINKISMGRLTPIKITYKGSELTDSNNGLFRPTSITFSSKTIDFSTGYANKATADIIKDVVKFFLYKRNLLYFQFIDSETNNKITLPIYIPFDGDVYGSVVETSTRANISIKSSRTINKNASVGVFSVYLDLSMTENKNKTDENDEYTISASASFLEFTELAKLTSAPKA